MRLKKLDLKPQELRAAVLPSGLQTLAISDLHAEIALSLDFEQGDYRDRIPGAQTRLEHCPFVSTDTAFGALRINASGEGIRMNILPGVSEAAERLERRIDLGGRGDVVLICRAGTPVAELTAIPQTTGTLDDVSALSRDLHPSSAAVTTCRHDDLYDNNGLPR